MSPWMNSLTGQQAALCLAAEHPLAEQVEGTLADGHRPHGVMNPTATQAGLGDDEGLTLATEQAVGRQPDVVVVDECVHPLVLGLAGQPGVAHDVHPGGVRRHQEHRGSLVDAHLGIGDGHDDEEGRRPGVGREELPTAQDPIVAVAHGPAGELLGVRSRLWLGHRVAREHLALEERLEIASLLLVGAIVSDDFGVSGVGCLGAEDDGGPAGSAEDLVEEGELDLPVALASELRS